MMETDSVLPVYSQGLSRRAFMLGGVGALLLPSAVQAALPGIRLLSPASGGGVHSSAALRTDGATPQLATLPMRGHGLLIDPRHPDEVLIMARRPGTLAIKLNVATGHIIHRWQAGEDRHFFGHACYSADGRTLFVTESDVDTGQGLVTVRDADDFRLLAEYRSHGIGPHELILLADGATLAVANGGIRTLPETGRVKLNRGRIESSLVYLDSRTGRLLDRYPVPSTQLSLRHLALAPNGRIAAALQFEGDRNQPGVPLMMFHRGEPSLQFADAPPSAWNRMRHYAASVAYDPASMRFALTCPRGDTLACWTAEADYVGHIELPKVSGIAFSGGQGFATNELGEVYRLDVARLSATLHARLPDIRWDNHLYIASAMHGT
jgi:hypothetical protein